MHCLRGKACFISVMYFKKCTDSQRKNIYDEINITEESLKRDVKYLMEWLEMQPHLPNVKG